jgi:hypothetical protein
MEQNVAMPMPRPATGNIDFQFIYGSEGFATTGYVPRVGNNKGPDENSGVTIASGFDLGKRTKDELRNIFRANPKIVQILLPFIGKKGKEADRIASKLVVDEFTARQIDVAFQRHFTKRLRDSWNNAGTVANRNAPTWDELPTHQATVVASVAYQYGEKSLPTETPKFWRYATSANWPMVVRELKDFKDETPERRIKEASYFEAENEKYFKENPELKEQYMSQAQQSLQPSSVEISTTPPHREQSQDRLGFTI